ncbi:LuxR C-terminal-related transcriptional regulator [Streptomyces racemochromogenes]|uniref:LuxR C-terminal-related transcriptional regulator n=1 Tax=Streptomyces racemochromogenes TaxID=67353 RepID=A0ABW7PF85_9ACTN
MLELLGLDAQTADVYGLMLANHAWGITEIARRLHITPADVRESLEKLTDLRLLHRSATGDELQPSDPALGLRELLNERKRELESRQAAVARCEADMAQLVSTYSELYTGQTQRVAQQFLGVESVQNRIRELSTEATSECLTFNPGGAQSQASLEASKPLDRDSLDRGVRMRTVYLDSVRNDSVTTEYAEWLTDLGGEVRTVPSLPLRMLIFDRKTVIVPADPENTRKGAVQLTEPGVVVGLAGLFDQIWESAVPLGTRQDRDDRGLTRQEKELLRLLGSGLTDEAAGRQLGLSLRTVRRMMAELMKRLGAGSRFEAGLRAAQREWV